MDISCAFATSSDTPAHVELAESLGYKRAWLYDSPALYPDVWMILERCAERTSRIGLGPGVLVPSLRHPMVNAAAIAELADRAPGRVAVAVGSGFTGRFTLGKRPMPWREVATYVRCLKALLAGETAEWDGAKIRMLQLPGFGAKRPINVPILIGADGPKGLAVAAELGDGVFSAAVPQPDAVKVADWRALLTFGTVLDEGEQLTSARAADAAAPGAVVMYHAAYERGGAAVVDALPGGRGWRAIWYDVASGWRRGCRSITSRSLGGWSPKCFACSSAAAPASLPTASASKIRSNRRCTMRWKSGATPRTCACCRAANSCL